jgi:hypothetical protein
VGIARGQHWMLALKIIGKYKGRGSIFDKNDGLI